MARFYLVGGAVRDKLMGIASNDRDYSVEAGSYLAMRQAILDRGGQIFVENPEFLTIRAKLPVHGACDYVLCRKEANYSDGRRPDKVEIGDLFDDLARRDFTMNAIAEDENGKLIDPHDGQADIQAGMIHCVGSADKRFGEDYLRMLRAIRFAVTKNMGLSDDIFVSIRKHGNKIADVSVERVREELLKSFKHDTLRTLEFLNTFDLDAVLFDGLGLRLEPTMKK